MSNSEKQQLLIDTLEMIGIEHELDIGSQFLRDNFPAGVPAENAIAGIKGKNKNNEFLENYALRMLAMVPVSGIQFEIIKRLESYRSISTQTKEIYCERFSLCKSLRYLNHPDGLKEFETLHEIMKTYPKDEEPVWLYAFIEFERELAKWKRDRAAGKRWEMFEDDD